MLEIKIIKCLEDNYSYLLKDKKTNLVAVVDPSEFKTVDEEINKNYKKLDFILNTHHHFDHVGGNLQLKTKYNAKVVCSAYDQNKVPGADIKKRDNDYFIFGETLKLTTLVGAGFIVVGTYIIFRRERTLKKQVVPPRYET